MIRKTILLSLLACVGLTAQARERQCFDKGWRFILADTAAMASPEYHDAFWRQLDVPHDWAIEGDFYAHCLVVSAGIERPSHCLPSMRNISLSSMASI